MTREELFAMHGPRPESIWTPWAKAVVFAHWSGWAFEPAVTKRGIDAGGCGVASAAAADGGDRRSAGGIGRGLWAAVGTAGISASAVVQRRALGVPLFELRDTNAL